MCGGGGGGGAGGHNIQIWCKIRKKIFQNIIITTMARNSTVLKGM